MIPLFQERTLLDRIRDGFGAYVGEEGRLIATGVGIVVLVLVGVALHALFSRQGKAGRKSRRLFRRLSEASGLTREESELLLRASRAAGMEEPAMIFVQRSVFESAAGRLGSPPNALEALRRKVYGP